MALPTNLRCCERSLLLLLRLSLMFAVGEGEVESMGESSRVQTPGWVGDKEKGAVVEKIRVLFCSVRPRVLAGLLPHKFAEGNQFIGIAVALLQMRAWAHASKLLAVLEAKGINALRYSVDARRAMR